MLTKTLQEAITCLSNYFNTAYYLNKTFIFHQSGSDDGCFMSYVTQAYEIHFAEHCKGSLRSLMFLLFSVQNVDNLETHELLEARMPPQGNGPGKSAFSGI